MRATGKIFDIGEQLVDQRPGLERAMAEQKIENPLLAVLDPLRQRGVGFRQTISIEEKQIAPLKLEGLTLEAACQRLP